MCFFRKAHTLVQNYENRIMFTTRSHGVMVSTLDSESSDPSSNLGGTYQIFSHLEFQNSTQFSVIFLCFAAFMKP